ncbi:hypothetical protein STRDD10_00736 [Streptococcus sp. DD10]|nr:hypothetical protein STRDD10_00736 [Streptococcus sp. DD10]
MFYFEVKRFFKNPKNKICLLILLLLFVALFILNQTLFQESSSDRILATTQMNLQQQQQTVKVLEMEVEQSSQDRELNSQLEQAKKEEEILSKQVVALTTNKVSEFADLQYQLQKLQLENMDQSSAEYEELQKNMTYYQAVKTVGGRGSLMINDTTEAAFSLGSSMTAWLSSTTMFVLFTVLVADFLSVDIESSQIRFYQLIGGRRFKNLLFKLLVPVLVTFLFTLLAFVFLYFMKGGVDGFGTWNYPYLLDNGSIFPIWSIVLRTLVLFFLSLIFLASLGQLLALMFKKSLVVIGLIIVCLTGFFTLSQEEWFQTWKPFVVFEYLSYGQLIHDVSILPTHSFWIGIAYLLSLSVLFFSISYYFYKKFYYRKDVKKW